ncbi:hydrolase [Planctomicrobium sp. SH668]|uniref:hydrolase n=1 Tax=Planctomicrobium sp. SH668 TaxID=3448126 RepID=UPI003F5C5818
MSHAAYSRSSELLSATRSRLLVVDMQERFQSVVPEFDVVLDKCIKLTKGAQLLNVPVSVTEQYPKGLGPTVASLAELVPERVEKLRFSCAECLDWVTQSGRLDGRDQVVIAGIETHVCMTQTALDLLAAGFNVYLVANTSRSRNPDDHELGLKRMSDAGVRLVTMEMVLFEWVEVAGSATFKQISNLVTGRS